MSTHTAPANVLHLTLQNGRLSVLVYSGASAGSISAPVASVEIERPEAWTATEAVSLALLGTGSTPNEQGRKMVSNVPGGIARHYAISIPVTN
jgi:hypothetical protein